MAKSKKLAICFPALLSLAAGPFLLQHTALADNTATNSNDPVATAASDLSQNRPADAINLLKAYTKRPGASSKAYRLLAQSYLMMGRPDQAIQPAEAAVKNASTPNEKATAELLAGDVYVAALNSGSLSSSVQYGGGPVMMDMSKMHPGAQGDSIATDPKYQNEADYAGAIGNVDTSAAQADRRRQMMDQAIKSYADAAKLDPALGSIHNRLGNADLLNGKTAEAQREFEASLTSDGPQADTYVGLGQVAAKNGDLERAIRNYKSAIELSPDNPNPYAGLAAVYDKQKNGKDAAWARGMAALRSGDIKGTQSDFDKAGDSTPGVLRGRAALALAKQDPQGASGYLAKALAMDPNDALALVMQGDLQIQRGDAGDAIKSYQAAIKADPNAVRAYTGLGQAYDNQNNPTDALAAYEQALKLSPSDQTALLNAATDSANSKQTRQAAGYLQTYMQRYPLANNAAEVEAFLGQLEQA